MHGLLRRSARHVFSHSHRTLATPPSANATSQLEKDGARILHAVQKRVEMRKNLLSKASYEKHTVLS